MKLKHALLLPFVTLSFSNALALPAKELAAEKRNIEQFLVNLGYQDYVKMMKTNLQAQKFVAPERAEKGETVLKEQIKNYAVFNDARELATQLLVLLSDDTMNADEVARDLTDFTVNMMKLAPLMPKTDYDPEATEDQAWDAAWTEATRKIEHHTEQIAADLINVLFNKADEQKFARNPENEAFADKLKEFKSARAKMTRMVKFMYTNSSMGHSAFLGKALAAGLLRADVKNGNKKFETALRAKLSKDGLFLENYVGTTLKVTDEKGQVVDVEIQNGDFILERSYGLEAAQITFAARPFSKWYMPGNLKIALQYKLLGIPGNDKFHKPDEGGNAPLVDAVEGFEEKLPEKVQDLYGSAIAPVLTDKIEDATHSKLLNFGISHAGMGMTKTDPETGISMAWAVDVYPNAGLGGVRVMDILGQFAKDGHYMRLGVSRHNPEKFYKHVSTEKSFIKEFNFHTGEQKPEEKVIWPTAISEAEYNQLMALGATDPNAWYEKVMRNSTDYIINEYLGKGLAFSYGFKNEPGQAYCSQLDLVAGLQSSGIDFQSRPDVWDPLIIMMKKKGAKAVADVDTNLRIVAPAGFMWQSDIVDKKSITVVSYKYLKTEHEMAEKMFMADYKAADKTIATLIKKDSDFDVYLKHSFTQDDVVGVAQDEMTSYRAAQAARAERAAQQALYGDRSSSFFGATLNFIEQRRANGKQAKPEAEAVIPAAAANE